MQSVHVIFAQFLMMKQPDPRKAHRDIILVAGLDHIVIPDGTAGLRDVPDTASVCPLHIVPEREERIRTKCHIGQLVKP